jgi:tripartite-type tricarboxylate transporter receptor subunit TctC
VQRAGRGVTTREPRSEISIVTATDNIETPHPALSAPPSPFGRGLSRVLANLFLLMLATPALAQQSVESFYRGKTIDLYIGLSAGGGYDLYARLIARYMGDHLPGKPRINPRNMAGAGSRVAINFMHNVAPKDGLAIATADQAMAVQQAVGEPGILFDARNFGWIGNPIVDNNVVVAWGASGVRSIADATTKEIAIGATGYNTSSQYPRALNFVAGTKFRIIMGYPGANEINLAMENGEVQGRGSNSWSSYKAQKPDWLRDRKINVLVQVGLTREPDLPDVPLLVDLATNDLDRAALKLLSAPPTVGRPIFTTPGIPAERLNALRGAFDDTMKDPAFLDEAKRAGLDIDPVSGVKLQDITAEIVASPREVTERLSKIIEEPTAK